MYFTLGGPVPGTVHHAAVLGVRSLDEILTLTQLLQQQEENPHEEFVFMKSFSRLL